MRYRPHILHASVIPGRCPNASKDALGQRARNPERGPSIATWIPGSRRQAGCRRLGDEPRNDIIICASLVGDVDPDSAGIGQLVSAHRTPGEKTLSDLRLLAAAERHRREITAGSRHLPYVLSERFDVLHLEPDVVGARALYRHPF